MLNRGGLRGADNVFDDFKTGSTELVAVVDNVAHARLCSTGRVGGAHNVLDDFETGSTELTVRPPMHRHLELAFESAV